MHLPPVVALILGIIGGAAEIVQEVAINMSAQAHSIVAFTLIVIMAFGVVPLSKAALGRLIPAHIAAFLTAAVGILAGVQRTFNTTPTVHSIIVFVLALFASVGIVPSVLPPEPAKKSLVAAGLVPATMAMAVMAALVAALLTAFVMVALLLVA